MTTKVLITINHGGYRRHNTILLTLIGIWFCLLTFGTSEGSDLLRQLKGRSKIEEGEKYRIVVLFKGER